MTGIKVIIIIINIIIINFVIITDIIITIIIIICTNISIILMTEITQERIRRTGSGGE